MLGARIRRGLLAGALAGLLAGLFALLVGEGPVAEAVRLEEQRAVAAAGQPAGEGFTVPRSTQQTLLPAATALVGLAVGGVYGLAYGLGRRRIAAGSEWSASLRFGGAAYLGASLLPSLKYPGNPPAVGDPGTVATRSGWFLAAVALGLLLAAGLWMLARRLRDGGMPAPPRHVLVGLLAAGGAAALLVGLPPNPDPVPVPADLLWRFRLASLGTQLVLWAGLAVMFGWLSERASTGGGSPRRPAGVRA